MSIASSIAAKLDAVADEIIEAGRYLAARHYHAALAGNISARISEDLVVCTRHGADKGALTINDLVVCNMAGKKVEGKGEPTSELNMHRAAYVIRSDIRAVIHAHPPTATGFAAASAPLNLLQLPEMVVLLGPIALVPYATPGSEELGRKLATYLPDHDAVLLENHGALTVGLTPRQAALRMELVEQNARITLVVRQLGPPYQLNPDELGTLLDIRRRINPSTTGTPYTD